MHEFLTEGIRSVTYTDEYGAEQNPTIWLIDYGATRTRNDFMAAQPGAWWSTGSTSAGSTSCCTSTGCRWAFIELKKAGRRARGPEGAHAQLMTYVDELPLAFRCNVACVVSDGIARQYGTAFTPFEHFAPWNVDDDGKPVKQPAADLTSTSRSCSCCTACSSTTGSSTCCSATSRSPAIDGGLVKRIAKPHQYFAVSKAVRKTIEAVRSDGRAGVVWHTQGSGKSMEMELYANQVLSHRSLGNPTIVVLTDRTDLDDQLYDTFEASDLLPETAAPGRHPRRAARPSWPTGGWAASSSPRCRSSAAPRRSGRTGRPHPLLSDRRNVIVIVDEAHRCHYDDLNGYARHLRDALPHATFIAFTGTPISEGGPATPRAVFGDYIDDLRPDPGGRGRRDRPGVLREPPHPAQPARGREPGADRRAGRRGDRGPGRLRARAHPAAVAAMNARLRRPGPGPRSSPGPGRALGGPLGARCASSSASPARA